MKKIYSKDIMESDERKDWFIKRTQLHIKLVQKYLHKILELNLPEIDSNLLKDELQHDQGKFKDPELEPYIHIAWKYRMQDLGKQYDPPSDIENKMHMATWHHVKHNKHHPEYWDNNVSDQVINNTDRDAPSKEIVNATKMPPTYVATMVADWLAMSEEKGTNVRDWADKNINVRWRFTPTQQKLIYKIIKDVSHS